MLPLQRFNELISRYETHRIVIVLGDGIRPGALIPDRVWRWSAIAGKMAEHLAISVHVNTWREAAATLADLSMFKTVVSYRPKAELVPDPYGPGSAWRQQIEIKPSRSERKVVFQHHIPTTP